MKFLPPGLVTQRYRACPTLRTSYIRSTLGDSRGSRSQSLRAATAQPSLAEYPAFDWLRFAAASVVCLAHAGLITWGPAGNLAVQVFFALSGWLIGGILIRTNPRELPRFFYNRATRIWIPYVVAVALLYGFALAFHRAGNWEPFLFHDLTFTHNWFVDAHVAARAMPLDGTGAHFWSISVEEQFYLLAPLVIVLLPGGRLTLTWVLAGVVCLVAAPAYYGSICLGVLMAVGDRKWPGWYRRGLIRGAMLLVIPLGTIAIVLGVAYLYVSPVVAICVVMSCAVRGSRTSFSIFIGGISFPLYLNHWAGLFAGNILRDRLEVSPTVADLAAYAVAVVIATALYQLVDRQVLRARSHFYTPTRGAAATGVAYALLTVGTLGGLALAPLQFPNFGLG